MGITATSPAEADARIDANQNDAILGFSVAGAGDVNNDGFDDIIVGVPRQGSPTFPSTIPPNQGQSFGGAAVVFHGSAAGITATGFDDADATLLPYPDGFPVPSQQFMGSGVSGAGDVNGDGFDDVLVYIDGAALFLGSATGIVGTDPTTAHAHIAGPGGIVSGAGDVNNDGFGDIILGAPGFPDLGNPPGASFERSGTFGVFLGSSGGITATDFNQAQTLVQGVHAWQVAAAGDIDNDGFDDVLVGALGFVGGLNSEGAAYLFRGGPSGIDASSELDAYVRIESNQSEAVRRLNRNDLGVAGAGNVNGYDFADVIVGFGYYDVDQLNEGAAFVYHGGPAPPIPNQPPVPVAGPNQVFVDFDNNGWATITVDGSASFDLDGSIVSYAWLEGETLLGTSPVLTTTLLASGDHRLWLTVTDDAGITRGDAVTVRVEPVESVQVLFDGFTSGFDFGNWVIGGDVILSSADTFPDPPQVRLGTSGAFLSASIGLPVGSTGMEVSFWGKASQFSEADELLVKVSVDGGPFTTIHTITSAESDNTYVFYGGTVIPIRHSWFPATASNIVLEFESNMTTGLFFVDLVKVKALLVPPGTPSPIAGELPIADAGADTTVDDNDRDGFEFVTLDGSLSSDPDGFIESYQWFEVTSGGTSLLGTGATLDVSFQRRGVPGVLGPEVSGDHTVQLLVTDNDGGSASDTVEVTVNQALSDNQPPVANAGLDLTVTDFDGDTLEFVHFDGRASTDTDGTIVSYNWTENGNPLNNAPTFTITMPIGVHTVELIVTDNQGATSSADTVVITVVAASPAPPIDSFSATPTSITAGGTATLSWTTTGADSVVINAGPSLPLDGSMSVSPTTTTLYILTAIGPGGASSANVTITVTTPLPGAPTVDSFSATPTSITAGGTATLSWTTTGADSVSIGNGVGAVGVDGSVTVNPTLTTTYILTATAAGGTATSGVTVTVNPALPGAPTVDSFSATPTSITAGGTATLSWTTTGADSVSIDNGVGAGLAADGSSAVNPATTTSYILTATGPGGTTTSSIVVTVSSAPSEALTITRFQFRASKNEWRIEGTSTIPGPGNTMTLYVGPIVAGSPVLGTAAVDNLGNWQLRERNSSVIPDSSGTISIQSSQGGTWEGISGVGPAPSSDPLPSLPSIDSFSTAPSAITVGATSTLTWTTSNATSVAIDNGLGPQPVNGSIAVSPASTTTYVLTAQGTGDPVSAQVTVIVDPAPLPVSVDSFTATPTPITAGDSTTLAWTTSNATSVSIDNGLGPQPVNGSIAVSPASTTTYVLTAQGTGGPVSAQVTVIVDPAPLPVSVDSFTATPTPITAGDSTTLAWTTSNATGVSIDNGLGPQPVNGSIAVSPASTTTYVLTAQGTGGPVSAQVTVIVDPAPLPVSVDSFTATPTPITAGDSTTLAWTTSNATGVSIDNGLGPQPVNGSIAVSPASTTTYVLTAQGTGGPVSAQVTVIVDPAPLPVSVDSFTATPTPITAGDSTTLAWTTSNASGVSIDNGVGPQPVNGSIAVSPASTTTYVLSAQGTGGPVSAQVTVIVDPAPLPVSVDSFTATPTPITAGDSTTLAWTTSNATSVSIDNGVGIGLVANGSTTVTPSTTTTYLLTATGASGTASSSVTVTVNSAASPQGSVSIGGPSSIDRGERTSFTVTFTNTGSSTIAGGQLTFSVTPNDLLKDVSPGSSVAVGDVPPGGSVSQTWNVRGDNEGSGSITASASSGGTTLDSLSQSLTVVK